ncbi:bacteriohopanetetrol glucosamine biosynthesis glycosyltransferase HpnI [Paraburkholderia phenoliruptrix]|uniref:bacteriohopanetetrol glucosamine biosynthesis glycosyltransferase HpnI n=1 Tax=Paraburkholderia phenoliruptrix TaxID=252970 RepID=UPI001C6F28DB|nr:bacteriohopanetetrol glucosamine biosynthesis glycosyltransferase HpnI [Paraburkholderia phenoliruptrix]MBW9107804.1 bacteriohopanetetrol glucosamine biosynthesis glycosyltransferase HpnI [Paraburkholderia phenoliruptrix]MBW9133022.1 bacteriohopanetetrol glucosamine biosynthesis glycosyltransferase HpnI [Paraburkholderia ginsengiterrae]
MAAHAVAICEWVLLAGCIGAALYAVVAAVAMPFFTVRRGAAFHANRMAQTAPAAEPAALVHGASLHAASYPSFYPFGEAGVTVLKPLCGNEPRLYENLTSFCEQRHTRFQLLLGVSSPDDPAIAVVHRLQAAYPALDIQLVVDTRVHGANRKVSNLINMMKHARHDVIVIADSDIAVEADYLESIAAPLADPGIGVLTCLYVARSVGGFWSRMGTLFINEWFAPSVRVAHIAGSRRFGFGATLALRRATLERIGGFEVLRNCLADDYWLAEHARAQGLRTVLSRVMVATDVVEPTFAALWQRETRWLRTIRSVNPLGFAFLFVTFATPWLVASGCLTGALAAGAKGGAQGLAALVGGTATAVGIAARLLLHARAVRQQTALQQRLPEAAVDSFAHAFWRDLPLVPLRDTLLLLQWCAGCFGSHVVWRGACVPLSSANATPRARSLQVIDVVEVSDGR